MIHFRHQPDKPSCPAGWEITRALSQPETSADVLRHMVRCAACTQLAAELGEVVAAAAELPSVAPMSEASREELCQHRSEASVRATVASAFRLGLGGQPSRGRGRGLCPWTGNVADWEAAGLRRNYR